MTLRVLCLDGEGGYGGASRSLYESIAHMDRGAVSPVVWCARQGPVVARYQALGVPCTVEPLMPRFSALPRLSRNLYGLARAALAFRKARPFLARLAEAAGQADVIHFNHEGLFLLARWLGRRSGTPIVMHVRTNLVDTWVARWQSRLIGRVAGWLVFITENERDNFTRLGGDASRGRVILNIVRPPAEGIAPHPGVPADGRFNVAALANFALVRGTDRLLDIAAELKRRGRTDIRLIVAGDMTLRGRLPAALKAGGTMEAAARARGLDGLMLFLGHVAEPERVLKAAHALIRPSRGDDPWGRDVLEALAAGLPVIATGRYDRFVESGATGILLERYDTGAAVDAIIGLADDRARAAALGAAGRARVLALCDGAPRAADLLAVWREAASHTA
ncbi:MAG: glycosyltransferase family 4 protein [Alphaproteobacteria bacterium]